MSKVLIINSASRALPRAEEYINNNYNNPSIDILVTIEGKELNTASGQNKFNNVFLLQNKYLSRTAMDENVLAQLKDKQYESIVILYNRLSLISHWNIFEIVTELNSNHVTGIDKLGNSYDFSGISFFLAKHSYLISRLPDLLLNLILLPMVLIYNYCWLLCKRYR